MSQSGAFMLIGVILMAITVVLAIAGLASIVSGLFFLPGLVLFIVGVVKRRSLTG